MWWASSVWEWAVMAGCISSFAISTGVAVALFLGGRQQDPDLVPSVLARRPRAREGDVPTTRRGTVATQDLRIHMLIMADSGVIYRISQIDRNNPGGWSISLVDINTYKLSNVVIPRNAIERKIWEPVKL